MTDSPDLTWYAAYTVPQQERMADCFLRLRDYETFYPIERVRRRRRREGRIDPEPITVKVPYFPRYIFVAGRPGQSMGHVFGSMGVVDMVRYAADGMPARVPSRLIGLLLAQSSPDLPDPANPNEPPHGRRVMGVVDRTIRPRLMTGTTIRYGIFTAEVSVDDDDGLRVWLTLLGGRKLVPISDPDSVEVLAPPPDTARKAQG